MKTYEWMTKDDYDRYHAMKIVGDCLLERLMAKDHDAWLLCCRVMRHIANY